MVDWVGIYSVVLFVGSILMTAMVLVYARMRACRTRVKQSLERCYLSILNRHLLEGGVHLHGYLQDNWQYRDI
jgi:hypothetical protein